MRKKEYGCSGCQLEKLGVGFAPGSGPVHSDLFFMGEALGREEAYRGEPFVGPAGGILTRVLRLCNLDKQAQRIDNVIRCEPPGNELVGAAYEYPAIAQCRRNYGDASIEAWLQAGDPSRKVMVTLGKTPLINMLELDRDKVKVQDFHGTINRDRSDRFWIVPTYHPSFIQRGAFNLLGTMRWDIDRALEVSRNGHVIDNPDIVCDPPIAWFEAWVDQHCAYADQSPDDTWLAVDIETLEKGKRGDEGELTHKDKDFHITRVNFSNNVDEGITVPFVEPYISGIKRLCGSRGPKVFWNEAYDLPRLAYNGVTVTLPILDAMWMWHHLQSDLPRGLGFAAPFYSKFGPWKHLSSSDPVRYAAIDGFQTLRCAFGISEELKQQGMWESYWRHVYILDNSALRPSEEVGFNVDKPELERADIELDAIHDELHGEVQKIVPVELHPLVQPLKKPPKDLEAEEFPIVERQVKDIVKWCDGCGNIVTAKHKNIPDTKTPCPAPNVQIVEMEVTLWYRQKPFNIASPDQLLSYMHYRKHSPGIDKKTKRPTTNKDTIRKLANTTDDPLYPIVLRLRQVDKIRGTYIKGTKRRLAEDQRSRTSGRLHPTTGHKPSTQRLSQQNPNLQNVVARGADERLASLFRRCLIAQDDCVLIESDFSGIEAVETGWFAGDADYVRLAWLGVHAYLASHLLYRDKKIEEPASLAWSNDDLLTMFAALKVAFPVYYEQAKRTVHASSYGMSPRGLCMTYPELFKNDRQAEAVQHLFFELAPKVPKWQTAMKEQAAKQGHLGGSSHPFHYKHYFYNVVTWRMVRGPVRGMDTKRQGGMNFVRGWGDDAKRAIAFFPQSTAAGVIKEAMLRLFVPGVPNYIGDVFFGRTPLRAQVHDSLVLEVPKARLDEVLYKLVLEMSRPILQQPMLGPLAVLGKSHLTVGVEVKVGQNWAAKKEDNLLGMDKIKLPGLPETLAADGVIVPVDVYDDDLDAQDIEELVQEVG